MHELMNVTNNSTGMQIIAGSWENYPAVNEIFPAVKHYFFLQNVFKCCQKIVINLFHLFTPSNLGIACQRHARVGLWPKYPPIIARFPTVKNFSYIPKQYDFLNSKKRKQWYMHFFLNCTNCNMVQWFCFLNSGNTLVFQLWLVFFLVKNLPLNCPCSVWIIQTQ